MRVTHQKPAAISSNIDAEEYVRQIEESPLPPLIRPERVAQLLDMSRRRVYELVETGDLAAIRHGVRGLRVYRQSLIDWLRRGGSGPGQLSAAAAPTAKSPARISSTARVAGKSSR